MQDKANKWPTTEFECLCYSNLPILLHDSGTGNRVSSRASVDVGLLGSDKHQCIFSF